MNGIKMSDCKFYVDEAAGVVVCVIPDRIVHNDHVHYTSHMVLDFIQENFRFADISFPAAITMRAVDKLRMPASFTGKAVCAPEDVWDEETGRMLAFARAKEKCYSSFFKRANWFAQAMDGHLGDAIAGFNKFGKKLEDKRQALQTQIKERTGAVQE